MLNAPLNKYVKIIINKIPININYLIFLFFYFLIFLLNFYLISFNDFILLSLFI